MQVGILKIYVLKYTSIDLDTPYVSKALNLFAQWNCAGVSKPKNWKCTFMLIELAMYAEVPIRDDPNGKMKSILELMDSLKHR